MSKIPAVIYARFSSSNQREESIEGQIRECTEFAERNGYEIIKEYTDKALTGRTDRRPGFQQMIADSEKRQFKAVIVWKMDRFARNRYDSAMYKHRLKKNGVKLVYARESVPEGAEGIILESVMEGFAEYYSANLAENVKRGNYDSALQHKTLGKRVLGLRKAPDGTFEIDPVTEPVIKRIFAEYDAGKAMIDICAGLNADGFRTVNGGKFNKSSLGKLLKNEKYIGTYKFGDICDENVIPPIIEKALFDRVQKRLSQNAHSPRSNATVRFLLTGKLFCGHCGEQMTGDSGTSSSHGHVYRYYTCNNRRKHLCDKKRANKDHIEQLVVAQLMTTLHDEAYINELADLCIAEQESTENPMLDALLLRQKETDTKLRNVMNAIEAGIITETTKEALQRLENEKTAIASAIAQERIEQPKLSRDDIIGAIEALRDGKIDNDDYVQILIDTFLNAVYLYDDGKMTIHLNFVKSAPVSLEYSREAVRESTTCVSQVNSKRTMVRSGIVSIVIEGSG